MEWEAEWDMEFNPSKCTVLQVTSSRTPFPSSHGQVLETVSCAKYIRVNISNDLSWSQHEEAVSNSGNRTLRLFKRNIRRNNPGIRSLGYKVLVRPVGLLEYASATWSPHCKTDIDRLEMVPGRAARWVHNDYSYTPGNKLSTP